MPLQRHSFFAPFLGVCLTVASISAANLLPDYGIAKWETEEGLPENSVRGIVQTSDGFLWLGTTSSGLARFDGLRFVTFDTSNTPGLPSDGIINLFVDSSNRLWISTIRGLVISEPKRWTTFRSEPRWKANYVRSFSENSGVICLTSFDGRVFRATSDRFEELPNPPGDKSQTFFGHVDKRGRVWIAHHDFYGHWDGMGWLLSPTALAATNDFRGAGPARDGNLSVLTASEILRLDGDQIRHRIPISKATPPAWHLLEDHSGTVWLPTPGSGLYTVNPDGVVRHFSTDDGLTQSGLRFAFEDRENNIWIGTAGGGLMRFKPRVLFNYGREHGLPEPVVKAVVEESPGQILVGTYGRGLARFSLDRRFYSHDPLGEQVSAYIQCLMIDREKNVWVGTFGSGLHVLSDAGRRHFGIPDVGGENINAIVQDSRGNVWVGGDRAAALFARGSFTLQPKSDGSPLGGVLCFAESPSDHSIWAGTLGGLFRHNGSAWVEVKQPGSSFEVPFLHFDRQGALWIAQSGSGLARLKDAKWASITETHGLTVDKVSSILEDDLGHWWLGSNTGILRIVREELERVADGLSTSLSCLKFNRSDGMASVECASGFQSTALKSSDGRLWFPTLKGVVMVDPGNLVLNTNPPPVYVQRVTARNNRGKQNDLPFRGQPQLTAPPGTRQLVVHFAALSYTAPEKMKIVYSTDDEGGTWTDISAHRAVAIETPTPGTTRLRIKASNNDGVWNDVGATLALTVQPFFWQTFWFQGSLALGALAGVGGIVWGIQHGRLRRQQHEFDQERALAEEKARLASVLEGTSDFVGFAAPDGTTFYINPAGRQMIGLAQTEDVTRLNFRVFFDAATNEFLEQTAIPEAIERGTWNGEGIVKRRDGVELIVSQVIVAHKDARGDLLFLSSIIRDITQRKQAEDNLRQSEERTRLILEHALDAVVTMSSDGLIVDWNPQAHRIFGWSRNEVLGRKMSEVLVPERYRAMHESGLRRFLDTGERRVMNRRIEMTGLHKNGHELPVELAVTPIVTQQGVTFSAFLRDLSEVKRAQQEKANLEAQLRQSQKVEAIGTLAGGIAHDFNNILGAIMAFTDLARMDSEGNPEVQASLDEVSKASNRAKDLVKQILAFSRQQVAERKPIRLQGVVREALKLLRSTIPANIELINRVSADAPPILADSTQIHQVVLNLCTNAAHAIGQQTGRIEVKLIPLPADDSRARSLPDLPPGPCVRLSCSDTGHGIDSEVIKRIFDPFFTTKGPGQGTGLGLAVVHGIVKGHEGAIQVESEPGRGSTFHLYFPALPVALSESFASQENLPAGHGELILIVDDEEALCSVARRVLERLNYEVVVHTDPIKALHDFHSRPRDWDLVITDLSMPGMTGMELASHMFQICPNQRIVLATGFSGSWTPDSVKSRGIIDLIHKPMTPSDLAEAVERALQTPAIKSK